MQITKNRSITETQSQIKDKIKRQSTQRKHNIEDFR